MDSNQSDLEQEQFNLLFGVRRSIRYHNRRRLFFDRLSKLSDMITAISGSATVASVLSKVSDTVPIAFAAVAAVSSAINLVLATATMARQHHDLARQFITLEKEILKPDLNRENLQRLTEQRLDIEANEPPPLRVLDSICHNELAKAMGYNGDEYIIRPYQRIFAHFFDIASHSIKRKVTNE